MPAGTDSPVDMGEGKRKPPAFQFYPGDFLSDDLVAAMTMEEVGVHIVLLCHAWMNEGIPDDPAWLARLVRLDRERFDSLWEVVGRAWGPGNGYCEGKLVNGRMERERAKQDTYRRAKQEAGRKGGLAKARNQGP